MTSRIANGENESTRLDGQSQCNLQTIAVSRVAQRVLRGGAGRYISSESVPNIWY